MQRQARTAIELEAERRQEVLGASAGVDRMTDMDGSADRTARVPALMGERIARHTAGLARLGLRRAVERI